jgi:predicted membrane channel-forming protein YqfA (hemolysin III family)
MAKYRHDLTWSKLAQIVQHPISIVLARLPVVVLVALVAAKMSDHPNWKGTIGPNNIKAIAFNTSMLFIGALLLSAGWLLYILCCPREIKRHPVVETYVTEQIIIGFYDNIRARVALVKVLSDAGCTDEAPKTLKSNSSADEVRLELREHDRQHLRRATSHAFWHLQNGALLYRLRAAWLLLVSGSVIAAWPTLTTFARTFRWLVT